MTTALGRAAQARLRALAGPPARVVLAWAREWSGRNARDRERLDGRCAAVLMYHRVLPSAEARRLHVEPGMFVAPQTFARQLDWLVREFSVLPLHEIVSALQMGKLLPRGACAITFDDGWLDNAQHALPALTARGLPATIFVVTDRVGTSGGFWPDEICRRLAGLRDTARWELLGRVGLEPSEGARAGGAEVALAVLKRMDERAREGVIEAIRRESTDPAAPGRELLDWAELDRLARSGIDIESHAASHAILTGVSREVAAEELTRSLATLRERGHGRHALLAYPSGAFDAEVVELARQAGYRAAFTTQVGLASGEGDPLCQPRLAVHEDISRTRAEFLRWVPGVAGQAGRGAS